MLLPLGDSYVPRCTARVYRFAPTPHQPFIPSEPSANRALVFVAALAACGGSSHSSTPPPPAVTVNLSPTATSVPKGQTTQFAASVRGSSNQPVTWKVNGVTGGDAAHGMVSTSGLYTAPASIPNPAA